MSILDVNTGAVDASALTETVISGDMAAATAAGSAALVSVVPMAADADSAAFAAALNGAGAAYLGVSADHVGQRFELAGAQGAASVGYLVGELLSAVKMAL